MRTCCLGPREARCVDTLCIGMGSTWWGEGKEKGKLFLPMTLLDFVYLSLTCLSECNLAIELHLQSYLVTYLGLQ